MAHLNVKTVLISKIINSTLETVLFGVTIPEGSLHLLCRYNQHHRTTKFVTHTCDSG